MFTTLAHKLWTGTGRGKLVSMLTLVVISAGEYTDVIMSKHFILYILSIILVFMVTNILTHCTFQKTPKSAIHLNI